MAKSSRSKSHRRRRRRRVGVRQPRKTLLVFCEGEITEPEYLQALRREPEVREVASIRFRKSTIGLSPPLTLVKEAADAVQRSSEERDEIDEVWCLFDVEWPQNHPNLKQALDVAHRNNVKVAVSNPCFELWLALHFQDCAWWIETKPAERLRREHDNSTDKRADGATYMPRRKEAARRARALDEEHRKNGKRFPNDNPSSAMYLLLDSITRVT